MTMRNTMVGLGIWTVWMLAGCVAESGTPDDEVAQIGAALESDTGGMDMEDDEPGLGVAPELDEEGLLAEDPPAEDAMAGDPSVAEAEVAPGARVYYVAAEWGQIPLNLDAPARAWSGVIGVNRGAVVVLRTLRFEPVTDRVLPRTDPRLVAFTSATQIHNDGLVLKVIDPTPDAPEPLTIGYASRTDRVAAPIADLLGGAHEVLSDADGNRMIAAAAELGTDPCNGGFLAGRWVTRAPGRGVFYGRVVGAFGELRGHVRGIWGVRRSGEQVFFGKFVAADGRFRGLLVGHYADGHFEGRFLTRAGERGTLGGRYADGRVDGDGRGVFLGGYRETSCVAP